MASLATTGSYGMGGYMTVRIPSDLINEEGIASILNILTEKYGIHESEDEIKIYSKSLMTQLRDTGGYAAFYTDNLNLRDIRFIINPPILIIRPKQETFQDRVHDTELSRRAIKSRRVAMDYGNYLACLWGEQLEIEIKQKIIR